MGWVRDTSLRRTMLFVTVLSSVYAGGCSGVRVRSLADGRGLNQSAPYSPFGQSPQELCVDLHPKFLAVALERGDAQKLCSSAGYEDPSIPLRCFEKAAVLSGDTLTLKHRVDLCSGVEQDDDPPLACYENAEGVLGNRVSVDEKVRLCGGPPSDLIGFKRESLSRF